jgi:hypothetical protein
MVFISDDDVCKVAIKKHGNLIGTMNSFLSFQPRGYSGLEPIRKGDHIC